MSMVFKFRMLSDENDRMAGAKGYLKVTVNILGPGDEAPVSPVHSLSVPS